MKIRFLADADFNQKIVSGLLLRARQIDFILPRSLIADGTKDPEILALAAVRGRVLVTHDEKTMPGHLGDFLMNRDSAGVILVPQSMGTRAAIEDLLVIWETTDAGEWINRIWRLPL